MLNRYQGCFNAPLSINPTGPSVRPFHMAWFPGVSWKGSDRPPLHLRQLHHWPLGLHPAVPQRAALLLPVGLQGPAGKIQGLGERVVYGQREMPRTCRTVSLHHVDQLSPHRRKCMTVAVFVTLYFYLLDMQLWDSHKPDCSDFSMFIIRVFPFHYGHHHLTDKHQQRLHRPIKDHSHSLCGFQLITVECKRLLWNCHTSSIYCEWVNLPVKACW